MSHIGKSDIYTLSLIRGGIYIYPLTIGTGHQESDGVYGILHGIEGFVFLNSIRALRLTITPLSLKGLDMSRVSKHDVRQITGSRSGKDLSLKALGCHERQKTRMIYMGMGQ